MPRIRDYNAEISAQQGIPGRRAQATDFGTMIDSGAAITAAADKLHDVVQRQEVSDVNKREAELRAELTLDFDKWANEGEIGDPTFAEKFQEHLDSRLAKFDEKVWTGAGHRAATAAKASLSSHFVQAAGLHQARSMGNRAVLDYKSALDANRNTLITDPSQFGTVLEANNRALNDPDGLYANMPAAKRAELAEQSRKELALSAVQGVIRQNPEEALAQLNDGRWGSYLDADNTVTLQRQAEIAIRSRELESARLQAAAERKQREAQRATEDAFIKTWVADPTSLSPSDVANSNLTPDDKIKWVNMITRGLKPERITTDADTFISLWDRVHLPDDHPNKLREESDLNEYFGRGLTAENINTLRNEIAGRRTEAGRMESELKDGLVKLAKTTLTGTNPLFRVRDPKGDEQLQKFMSYFLPEYDKRRKAGKTPEQLLDPDSPDYLGKAIGRYERPAAEFLKDLMEMNQAPSVPGPGAIAPEVAAPMDKSEHDELLPGTRYRAPDGSTRVKGYDDAADVQRAYKAGNITRDEAARILREKGWAK